MGAAGVAPATELPSPPRAGAPAAPAPAAEQFGRVVLAAAVLALFYALAAPVVALGASQQPPALFAGLRAVVFAFAALAAVLLQGARLSARGLLGLAGAAALFWLGTAHAAARAEAPFAPSPAAAPGGGCDGWTWLRFESGALLALALGTALARALRTPAEVLMVILCASSGDAWFSAQEGPSEWLPLRVIQLAWPPRTGLVPAAPHLAELLFLALYVEATHRLGAARGRAALGAILACFAATLVFDSLRWPGERLHRAVPALPLIGLGVLAATWPRLRCAMGDVLRALAAALALFVLLTGCARLQRALRPPPPPTPFQVRDFARREVPAGPRRAAARGGVWRAVPSG